MLAPPEPKAVSKGISMARPSINFELAYGLKEVRPQRVVILILELGFQNPMKMIEYFPTLLSFDIEENIQPKIAGLSGLGFNNSVKMIERWPEILGLNLKENITPKIAGLRELGFQDPIKMIEIHPRDSQLQVGTKYPRDGRT